MTFLKTDNRKSSCCKVHRQEAHVLLNSRHIFWPFVASQKLSSSAARRWVTKWSWFLPLCDAMIGRRQFFMTSARRESPWAFWRKSSHGCSSVLVAFKLTTSSEICDFKCLALLSQCSTCSIQLTGWLTSAVDLKICAFSTVLNAADTCRVKRLQVRCQSSVERNHRKRKHVGFVRKNKSRNDRDLFDSWGELVDLVVLLEQWSLPFLYHAQL